ncbi:MAG TPA: BatA domain-containing protein [Longimicrobium sp.]|nr:BatA domain-containing protein [Longimicrobium sp.]
MGQPPAGGAVIAFAAPAFLVAGLLAALVPVALHLIRRRPPSSAPLPTQRFLTEDARNAVRVSRPTDLLLLALRMLLLALAGAALARPAWLPAPEGTSEIVLLDRGAAMSGGAWARAVGEARRALLDAEGSARGELVVFDTAATHVPRRRVTPALFDSLAAARPSSDRVDYAAALRSIRGASRELRGADSVRVTMLTVPRWGGWSAGMAPLRRAAWPGALAMPELGAARPAPADPASADSASTDATAADSADDAPRRAMVVASGRGGQFAAPALEATGWRVARTPGVDALPTEGAGLYVVLARTAPAVAAELRRRAEGGATVVVARDAVTEEVRGMIPWTGFALDDRAPGGIFLDPELRIDGASNGVRGRPAEGARVIAAWDDGRPAASAISLGRGCVVFAGTDLEGGGLPFSASFPRLLDRLGRGCESSAAPSADADRPLDAGARAVLRGEGPAVVAASAVEGAGGGVQLGRWLMAAALAVALIETFVAYRRRTA